MRLQRGVLVAEIENGSEIFCSQVKPVKNSTFSSEPRIISDTTEIYHASNTTIRNFVRVDDPTGEQWNTASTIICFTDRSDEEKRAISKKAKKLKKHGSLTTLPCTGFEAGSIRRVAGGRL